MLESLYVKNLALIEEAEVNFRTGFNVLTGETGAGKSIILGSINLALGGKADLNMIRAGKDSALIELSFSLETKEQRDALAKFEITPEDDRVFIQRKLTPTKSTLRVCGESVTQKQMTEIADTLIDIHGQYDAQFLRNKNCHMEILDGFLGEEIRSVQEELAQNYRDYRVAKETLQNATMDESTRRREADLIEYEYNEIEASQLTVGEDRMLEEQYNRMKNSKRLVAAVGRASSLLSYDENGAAYLTDHALRECRGILGTDPEADALAEKLTDIDSLLSELTREMANYMDSMEFSEEEYNEVESRLDLINRLKDKYGNTIEKILEAGENRRKRLEELSDYDLYRERLNREYEKHLAKVETLSNRLSKLRHEGAPRLLTALKKSLEEMNFLAIDLDLVFTEKEYTAKGNEDAEFLLSLNPGQPLRPLSMVASGGELSRIMLGLKSVLMNEDLGKTFIFDEIDAGISGRTAWTVAEKLHELATGHQIICITHLAQIAGRADTHFEIEKTVADGATVTQIRELTEDESVCEIARLLGSDVITESALNSARELKYR